MNLFDTRKFVFLQDRLRVVPHISSWIVITPREKGETRGMPLCLALGDFHARSGFALSIPEDKWGTTRSLLQDDVLPFCYLTFFSVHVK